jgi:hypothetical protein
VNVASGQVYVPGTEGATQFVYSCVNDATKNLTITASDPTNPRIDIVVAKVQDTAYSGGVNSWSLAVVAGTPSGSPAVPTAPANSVTLAHVAVAAGVTSIVNANITDKRPFAAALGGVIPCTNATRPTNIPASQLIYETDTDFWYYQNASAAWTNLVSMVKINENILGSGAASVTFSSIPQTYRTLELHVMARSDTAADFASTRLRFNSDSGTNYDSQHTGATGSSSSFFEQLSQTVGDIGECSAANNLSSQASMMVVKIPFYRQTTFWKEYISNHILSYQNSGGQASRLKSAQWTGRWRSTAAITSVQILPSAGNFITGSSFTLYGYV